MVDKNTLLKIKLKLWEIIAIIHVAGASLLYGIFVTSEASNQIIQNNTLLMILFGISLATFFIGLFKIKDCYDEKLGLDEKALTDAFRLTIATLFLLIISGAIIRLA
ncbi:MAG: hypothetical protein HY365_02355 [Candidatus Aenigmarchaeota archaeon]|nr:hypothetical protein [Candidatus Aenigmarchaeota archaeon]